MTKLTDLLPLYDEDGLLNVIIEIPKGSSIKYETDPETGVLFVDRILPSDMHYPQNYGLLPRTWCKEDDGELDVLIISNYTFAPHSVVKCRIIGLMEMNDSGEIDNKLLCIADTEKHYKDVKSYTDLPIDVLNRLTWFFEQYKLPKNKIVKIEGFKDIDAAKSVLNDAIKTYNDMQ